MEQLRLCGEAGAFEWFIEPHLGGQGWSEADLLRGYVQLAAACLTTTFVVTQRVGAMTRIAAGASDEAREELLPDLISGRSFATVGISHLTTSRQHLAKPVLRAEETFTGFRLVGYSPWVTGGEFAQHIVLGAALADGRQILIAMPTDLPGVRVERSPQLVGLSASHTGPVHCDGVVVPKKWLLAGPVREVMKAGVGGKIGGLQTSALAIGLATAAIQFIQEQAESRNELLEPADALAAERDELLSALLALASGSGAVCESRSPHEESQPQSTPDPFLVPSRETVVPALASANELRQRANSLALRATQAALAAAKGTGYCLGHPAGRWCREALFFLVWSCPQPVLQANLCELAGITN